MPALSDDEVFSSLGKGRGAVIVRWRVISSNDLHEEASSPRYYSMPGVLKTGR